MSDITFTLTFDHWTVVPKSGQFTNVITDVHWRLKAEDADGHEAEAFGRVDFPAPTDIKSYTAKEDITEDMLAEWVKPLMGYDAYVENLTMHVKGKQDEDARPLAEVPMFKKADMKK